MSATPRTDAAWFTHINSGIVGVSAKFAAQLERELAEVTAQRDALVKALQDVMWCGDSTSMYIVAKNALATMKGDAK